VQITELSQKEKYLRYIETCLFFQGGRWIANFDISIRNFNLSEALKDRKLNESVHDLDLLIYGGVKGKGFILSRAFAFLASPTYVVTCAVVDLGNATKTKWSTIVTWVRHLSTLMEIMEFEWGWILYFGAGDLPGKVKSHLERFNQRQIGLVYADLKNCQIISSDGFIARRGAKLFNPENMNRKGFRLKFWQKD
jgi:hypothetical protein